MAASDHTGTDVARKRAWYFANKDRISAKAKLYRATHKEQQTARGKAWYRANKEAHAVIMKAYRDSHKPEQAALSKAWYEDHKEAHQAACRRYQAVNADKISEHNRAYYRANRELALTRAAEWQAANPEKRKVHHANRRARSVGRLSLGLPTLLLSEQGGKCCYCFVDLTTTGYHMDHWVPLAQGGSNDDDNIVLACPACNMKKSARMPMVFMAKVNKWLAVAV